MTPLRGLNTPREATRVKSRAGVKHWEARRGFRLGFTRMFAEIYPSGSVVVSTLDLGWVRVWWGEVK